MIDDAKIRQALLERFPLSPSAFEMEEFEGGDVIGATYWTVPEDGSGFRLRVKVNARNRSQDEVTDDLSAMIEQEWFEPMVTEEPPPAPKRRGRPPKAKPN